MAIKLITNNNLTFTKSSCNCGIKSVTKNKKNQTNKNTIKNNKKQNYKKI